MGLEHNPIHRSERGGKAGLTVSLDCTQWGWRDGQFQDAISRRERMCINGAKTVASH